MRASPPWEGLARTPYFCPILAKPMIARWRRRSVRTSSRVFLGSQTQRCRYNDVKTNPPAVTRHIRPCPRHPSHSAQMTSWRLLQTLMDSLSFQARKTILPAGLHTCGCAICGAGGNLLDIIAVSMDKSHGAVGALHATCIWDQHRIHWCQCDFSS